MAVELFPDVLKENGRVCEKQQAPFCDSHWMSVETWADSDEDNPFPTGGADECGPSQARGVN